MEDMGLGGHCHRCWKENEGKISMIHAVVSSHFQFSRRTSILSVAKWQMTAILYLLFTIFSVSLVVY